jgi:hypothetical protein
MISSLYGGKPYESKYSAYPESEKQTATNLRNGLVMLVEVDYIY